MDHKAHGARKILEIKNHNEISVNNITYKVDSLDCDINLLDWIRDNTPFKGTKEGCNEGDCGACSVLVYDKNDKFPKPINSCLVRLGQLYKKNVITVEGLGSSKKLNPGLSLCADPSTSTFIRFFLLCCGSRTKQEVIG